MTRVLLVGNGAREHAIAAALHRAGVEILARMNRNNPGIARLSAEVSLGPLDDFASFPDLTGVDYAIIGPEAPLAAGVVDYLEEHGVPCVGPRREPAKIETSKVFARSLLERIIPRANPMFGVVRDLGTVPALIEEIGLENIVVKPDGLTGGKGVKIFGEHLSSHDDVIGYTEQLLKTHEAVVIEEKLQGTEFTVQVFVDGTHIEPMPLVRDFKRAYDGDTGPNTGSMGSYSQADHSLSYLSESDINEALEIMRATVRGIQHETGLPYRGILYGQFMKTEDAIKVIEYNARYGDPEAMNVLALLKTSMDDICRSIIEGKVIRPEFESLATVCVYVVPEGYPGSNAAKDAEIKIQNDVDSHIYYASVYEKDGRVYTTGSRALGVLATGATVAEAREAAYRDVKKISGRIRYRTDIAKDIEL